MSPSTKTDRRSFIKSTAAGTAGVFLLPSRIWSAETQPNDRLTLGFIGMGIQARGLLGGFLNHRETQTIAVCDVDTTRREHAKKMVEDFYAKGAGQDSYKGCRAYNDFRELLALKEIDAVVIATPDHWHAPISIAAAKAGKDIYCEKPLCQSIHEARAMVQAVRQNERVFQTGSMQRSMKEFRVACELVRNGRLGKISRVETGFGGPGKFCDLPEQPVEPGLDWEMWLGPAPQRPYHEVLAPRGVHKHFPNWRLYREYGGGFVTDWGAHHLDIAQWALGMDNSGPVEVIPPDDWKTAQHGVKLIYANGVEVRHIKENGVTFFGSDGELYVNRGKFKLTLGGKERDKDQLDAIAQEMLTDAPEHLYKSDDHKADWLTCIKTRKPPITDVEIGARTVTACHLTNFGYYYGQKLKWDPASEQFTGGTGNPKWLDVGYRDPWKLA